MSMTRSIVTAIVSYQRIYKDKSTKEVKTETAEVKFVNCRTREKAQILLDKKFRGDITELLSVQFHVQLRVITDEDFLKYSTVKSEKMVEEAEM